MKLIFCLFFLFISMNLFSQGIRGIITDDTKNPVPGASIYFQEIRTGTTSNNEGLYEIGLKEGVYTVAYQSLGYEKQEFRITISDKWLEHDVIIKPINFRLQEVTIYAGEDPAYQIMRKAISLAPYFLRQVKDYEAEVYLKGGYVIKKMPKLFQKMMDKDEGPDFKVGQTYTSESLNRIRFAAPDTTDHKVLAFQNSFPGENNSEKMVLGFINMSFYDTKSDETYVSPLSPHAFKYYNFRYEGFFDDGKYTVNRIKVIPKRKSQQLLEGEIYIVENLWCIHSVDLAIETFAGKMYFRQLFSEVKEKVWLPVNHVFNIDFSMMGIAGDINYSSAVKFLSVNINDDDKNKLLREKEEFFVDNKEEKEEAPSQNLTKNQKKIEDILSKEELNNRDMVKLSVLIEKENKPSRDEVVLEVKSNVKLEILKDSINRDSLFWNTIRPIPLTASEKAGFELSQNINLKDTSTVEKKKNKLRIGFTGNEVSISADSNDTTYKRKNTFGRVMSDIAFGAMYPRKKSKVNFFYGGLMDIDALDFNPVDGWKYGQNIYLKWNQTSYNSLNLSVMGGYAFARESFHGKFDITQKYSAQRRGSTSISGNIGTSDYNAITANNRLIFAAYSLFFKENYPRYFDNKSLTANNQIDLINGLQFLFSSSYKLVEPLENNTEFSFFKKDKNYKPNEILNNKTVLHLHFEEQTIFSINAKFIYTPNQRYSMQNGHKIMLNSKFPTYTFEYKQGIKAFSSNSDFILAEIGAYKKPEFSFRPVFSWNINAGMFLRNKQVHFSEFKHFNALNIILLTQDFNTGFFLLDNYEASTDKWYAKANGTLSMSYLMIKFLPFLSNKLWNENIHAGYLHTPDFPHYTQVGYSIGRIYLVGNIGVFASFSELKYKHWGVKVAFAF